MITNCKAMYKGVGTINNTGNYGFQLSAIDADLTPSTNVDLFRIRIWDRNNNDALVYDNKVGEIDPNADPTTAIGGGNIKIHSGNAFSRISSGNGTEEIFSESIPKEFALEQNSPNPFNPTTSIRIALPEAAPVRLSIYDINGREVSGLVFGNLEEGVHEIQWNATDNNGIRVASGIYLCRLQAGSFVQTRKMTLLK